MIHLIKCDPAQKKWALVLEGNPPTIEQFKRNPQNYKTLSHGFYEGEFKRDDIWESDNGFRARFEGTNTSFKVLVSHVQILDNIAAGNLSYNGSTVYLRGRFDKRGSEILFILGAE